MKAISELRNCERIYCKSPVMIEDHRTEYRYDGSMINFSKNGMYLETDYAPRPNRKIKIKVNNLPDLPELFENLHSLSHRSYLAEVRWRRPLIDRTSPYSYGIGVKYF